MEYRVSRSPMLSHFFHDRERKRFLACARNDGTRKTVFSHRFLPHAGKALVRGHGSPSFLWKEVPRKGGGWLTQRNKKEWLKRQWKFVWQLCTRRSQNSSRLPRTNRFRNTKRNLWHNKMPQIPCGYSNTNMKFTAINF